MAKKKMAVKKPAAAVRESDDGVGEADFLTSLATTQATEEKKKGGNPLIEVLSLAVPIKELAQAQIDIKRLQGVVAECEAEIFPTAESLRIDHSRSGGEHLSSVKITGGAGTPALTYTKKNAYSGIDIAKKSAAISAVQQVLGADPEDAKKLLDKRLNWVTKVSLKAEAFNDPEALAALKQHLSKYLTVSIKGYPTAQFHQDSTLDTNEAVLMEALEEMVNPHKASCRITSK